MVEKTHSIFYSFLQVKKSEDDFLEMACSDISQLCGEVVVLWNNFVNYFTGRAEISQHLARVHHHQRIKRFSEAFFLVDHPRKSALDCVEAMYTRYASLSESLRTSAYLISLPPLPVSCTELDGEAATMPIIFEDVYKDEEHVNDEFRKRRHSFSKFSRVTAFCLSFLCQLSQVLISARHSVTQSELEVHLSVKESFLKLFSNIIKK